MTRRDARECAVQLLFELDMNASNEIDVVLENFWKTRELDDDLKSFCENIIRGVDQNVKQIDKLLGDYAKNWDVQRMNGIDRNVMRMAMYELLYCEDIPPVVIINEAVDIAKYFGSSESGKFVNGVLDRAKKDIKRPDR